MIGMYGSHGIHRYDKFPSLCVETQLVAKREQIDCEGKGFPTLIW